MRTLALFAIAITLAGCSVLKPNYFWTCQDLTNVDVKLQGGATLHADTMLGSPVITAYGAAGGNLAGTTFAGLTGLQLAKTAGTAGLKTVGVLAPTTAAMSNRHTNRTPATPTPKPKP